jgi:hypothetical protein
VAFARSRVGAVQQTYGATFVDELGGLAEDLGETRPLFFPAVLR